MKLFDGISRADKTPARSQRAPSSTSNRSARPEVERIRELLEAWFDEYPDDEKQKLRNGFQNREYSEYLGAWWELYVFTPYRTLGYSVDVHPVISGSRHRPDFLISSSETSFYVECTAVSPAAHSGEPNLKGQHWIQDCINEVQNPNFYVDLRIEQFGTQQPRRNNIKRQLSAWLSDLDPACPARHYGRSLWS
jgi:hypothetical protein